MRRSWVGIAIAAGAGMVLAACGGGAGGGSPTASDVGVTKSQITIGATVPLSGPVAAYSTIAKASDAYFAYVNAHGGVNGRKIKYVYYDDNYNLTGQTLALTRQLVEQDNVFLTFGGLGTQAQTTVRGYLNGKKVPQLLVATGATTFGAGKDSDGKKYPYTFGWQPVYQGESLIYADYVLQHMSTAKIGVIYQNDDYGQDYLNGLKKGLGAAHQNLIVDVESNETTATDLSSQILALKSKGADTFFIFETPALAIRSIVTADKVGWHPTTFLNSVSAPIPYVQAAQKAAGDAGAVNGILSVTYLKDALSPQLQNDAGVKLYKQVMSQYYPTGNVNDAFNLYGVATAWTMVDILKKAGTNPTRASVLDVMNNLTESDNPFLLPGVTLRNSSSDHYSITQEAIEKYDAAAGDYAAVSGLIDVRGKIHFP